MYYEQPDPFGRVRDAPPDRLVGFLTALSCIRLCATWELWTPS